MKDINLINFKIDNKTKKSKKIIISLLFLASIGTVISFITLSVLIKKSEAEVTEIKKDSNKFVEVNILKSDIKECNVKVNQMKEVLESVSENSILNTKLLQEIAKTMPNDVCIVNYAISKTGDITLVGKSGSSDSIAYFRRKLEEQNVFSGISVKSIKSEGTKDKKEKNSEESYGFDMSLKLKR